MSADEYLKAYVESGHFSYGDPRSITVSADGKSLLFLRSKSSTSAVLRLFELDLDADQETLLIDLKTFASKQKLTPEEARLRERLRETAQGITSYSTDKKTELIVCHTGSTAILFNRKNNEAQLFELQSGAHSLQISPDGKRIAYVCGGTLWCLTVDSGMKQQVSPDAHGATYWGSAEFIAAEELNRYKGFWWSPTSDQLLVAKVDESAVGVRKISSSQDAADHTISMRYPMAGEPNVVVDLFVFDLGSQENTQLPWDRKKFEYLSKAMWDENGITIKVIARSQKQAEIISYDPSKSFKATVQRRQTHSKWLQSRADEVLWWQGKLVTSEYSAGVYCLHVNGQPEMSGINFQAVIGSDDAALYVLGNDPAVPEELHVYKFTEDDHEQLTKSGGYHTGIYDNGVLVTRSHTTNQITTAVVVHTSRGKLQIKSNAASLDLPLEVRLHQLGEQQIPTAVILPDNYESQASVPVIMCPYAGPWLQMVIAAGSRYSEAQWFAMQGYGVVICDGRGTPGKNEAWEYGVWRNLADPVIEDQVTGLQEALRLYPKLDKNRVGIRGGSFGGYLAALAVLERPDVFRAAVADAAVADWRMYDTFYSEQFLGLPQENKRAYNASSLLQRAAKLKRPLHMIHGIADDNVLVENAYSFSKAIEAAGKADLYSLQLIAGQTHMHVDIKSVKAALMGELAFFSKHLAPANVLE